MVDETDTDLLAFLTEHDMKKVVVPFPSTVENQCRFFADRIWPALEPFPNVDLLTIRIFETPNCAAEYSIGR